MNMMRLPVRSRPFCRGALLLFALLLVGSLATGARAQIGDPATASGLNLEQIRQAIDLGIDALYEREPNYTIDRIHRHYHNRYRHSRYRHGHHAIASWALLDAGESYQNPPLYRRVNWVLSSDKGFTYNRGMRAQMLAELPLTRWQPWVHRDRVWLTSALTNRGNYNGSWNGGQASGAGDHANGQYGVLGLWGIDRAGLEIPNQIWKKIDRYWRGAQKGAEDGMTGGWGLAPNSEPTAPMTAGGVAVLSVTEKMLHGRKLATPGANVSDALRRGVNWLDRNFTLHPTGDFGDWYYYMWTVQRVGRATGLRTLNGIDWYREGTVAVLNRQQGDGSWPRSGMMRSELLSTSFALLYLAKANEPVAVAKLRFQNATGDEGNAEAGDKAPATESEAVPANDLWGRWNNYPHDIWNFVEYISDHYEYSTTWQIMDARQPPYALIESPLLYLSTDQAIRLDSTQKENLKGFIEGGGLLVLNPDGNNPHAVRTMKELGVEMFGREFQKVESSHDLYHVHQQLGHKVPMEMVSNGIRPLMIRFVRDIGPGLQKNDFLRSESFLALSNLYLYATGRKHRRGRLENDYHVQQNMNPRRRVSVARIRHDGDFDPEPGALKQLKAIMADEHNYDLQIETVEPTELDRHQIAFLTTTGDGALDAEGAMAIRRWIETGGTLWIDGAGGSQAAAEKSFAMLRNVLPNAKAVPVTSQHPLVNGRGLRGGNDVRTASYRLHTLIRMGKMSKPRLQVVELGDRVTPAVVYSGEDLTAGLAGASHWGIDGYTVDTARRLVVNGVLMAARN